ncbi:MAG: cation-translocating P-type ATPase, partial [Nitrospirota bacterium]|nr:cation-translocating P-type ATPase [Nitrospirota bacterium]
MQDLKLQVINNSCRDERTCSCCAKDFFEERPPLWKRRKMINGSIAGALLAAGLFIRSMTPFDIASQIIFLSVIAVAGREILKKAWASIARLRLDMNCLMSIAAFGAFFIGHGEEGAAVIFLFYIAETLEDYAADNAKRSISQLLSLAPETARVKVDGQEKEIHTQEINTGDVVTVRPGEKVPLDGRVIHGHSSVNESAITGESAPAAKTEGDEVYAGTLNEEGYLEIEVTKRSGNTVLARIVRLVEEAERKKSKTEKHIDRFARIYTPVVIGLALAAFIVPVFIFGKPLDVWLYRALVLLVISCPCALAISTPVAMVSAISSASRHGVLIKGATFIEELSRIRAIAFDKTGTLTRGKFEVTDIVCFKGHSEKEVLSVAASIETRSGHPIARSIVKKAAEENVRLKEITGFQDIKGKGLRAQLNGKTYYAGAKNLFDALSVEIPGELAGFETEGRTTIFIADEDGAVGIIALGDRVRDRAPAII